MCGRCGGRSRPRAGRITTEGDEGTEKRERKKKDRIDQIDLKDWKGDTMNRNRRRKPNRRTMESVCCPSTILRQQLDFAAEYERVHRRISWITGPLVLGLAAALIALGVAG